MVELLIYAIFASGALILLGELASECESVKDLALPFKCVGTSLLFFLLPWIYYVLVGDELSQLSLDNAGPRRFVFLLLSWIFYVCCIVILLLGLGSWSWIFYQIRGWTTTLGVFSMLATVFLVSGVYAMESRVGMTVNLLASKLYVFMTMKVMLTILAAVLGILAEINWIKYRNGRLALFEAVLAIGLFIVSLFNTHGLGGRLVNLDTSSNKNGSWKFWQPFVGGAKFVSLQIGSWVLFSASIALEVAFILSTGVVGLELFVGVTAVAGTMCMVSEGLMILSLYCFEPSPPSPYAPPNDAARKINGTEVDTTNADNADVKNPKTKVGDEYGSWLRTGIYSQTFSQVLSIYVRDLHELIVATVVINIQYVPYVLLLPLFAITAQPLNVVTIHWSFACGVVMLHSIFCALLKVRAIESRASTKADSVRSDAVAPVDTIPTPAISSGSSLQPFALAHLCRGSAGDPLAWALPCAVSLCGLALSIMLQSFPATRSYTSVFPWAVFTVLFPSYVKNTYSRSPECSGWRDMRFYRDFDGGFSVRSLTSQIMMRTGELVRRYFRGRVIADATLDPKQLYVFGFHPHGVAPVTLFWMCASGAWERLTPGLNVSVLTASIMHVIPMLRDLLHWVGGLEITRDTFRKALQSGRNCVVIPGGQAEMMESRSGDRDIRVVAKHTGYIRMAMQEGASLVPMFSFGEVEIMDNIRLPTVQRWFLKRFGAAVPHYPYGYLLLPIPRRVPVTVIIGEPIPTVRNPNPTSEEVNQVLRVYMLALKRLFERHRGDAGEDPGRRLVFFGEGGVEVSYDDDDGAVSTIPDGTPRGSPHCAVTAHGDQAPSQVQAAPSAERSYEAEGSSECSGGHTGDCGVVDELEGYELVNDSQI